MKRLAIVGIPLALGCLLVASVRSQDAGRSYTMTAYGCGNGLPAPYDTHVVFWSSEGTAWETVSVYLALFNPASSPQWADVILTPDGRPPVVQRVTVAARSRLPILTNEVLRQAGMGDRVNFSTEVRWQTLGVAMMAVWDWDGTTLTQPRYYAMVQGCEGPVYTNPYGLETRSLAPGGKP